MPTGIYKRILPGNRKGMNFKHSNEARKNISKALKGKKKPPRTEEHKRNMSIAKKGKSHNPHSLETRKKISESHKGEKSYLWKGGITQINTAIRQSFEYKLWRKVVFERDFFTCVWCGYKSKGRRPSDIQADHIKPFSLFPELRFSIDNGRTLCINCHKKTDTWGEKMKTYKSWLSTDNQVALTNKM